MQWLKTWSTWTSTTNHGGLPSTAIASSRCRVTGQGGAAVDAEGLGDAGDDEEDGDAGAVDEVVDAVEAPVAGELRDARGAARRRRGRSRAGRPWARRRSSRRRPRSRGRETGADAMKDAARSSRPRRSLPIARSVGSPRREQSSWTSPDRVVGRGLPRPHPSAPQRKHSIANERDRSRGDGVVRRRGDGGDREERLQPREAACTPRSRSSSAGRLRHRTSRTDRRQTLIRRRPTIVRVAPTRAYGVGVRVAIVLFTRDLRVHDKPALAAAAREAEQVVPLFVPTRRRSRAASASGAASSRGARRPRRSLRERGGGLVVRRGDAVAETCRLAREPGAEAVFAAPT